ncbi:MAG: hypothetical protein LIO79_08385 [Rikenellaceae bacterium]|nr:hypothetical protein [Rikenellaceae bacterium]
MRYYIILIASLLIFCSAQSTKPERINAPDAGFKYKIRFEKEKNLTMDKNKVANKMKRLVLRAEDNYIRSTNVNHKDIVKSPLTVSRECYFYISDAYLNIDGSNNFDQIKNQPSFKGGDEGKFCKWIKKNFKFEFNQSHILNEAYRGHLIFHIVIDENGYLSEIKPLTVDDSTIDQVIFNDFYAILEKSPQWKPAKENGQNVEANYIIALVWGHYRMLETPLPELDNPDNPSMNRIIYEEAMENGYDPLYIFID